MVTSVRADYGMGIGKVVIDDESKSPKISQKVAGLDIEEYVSALKEAREVSAKPYKDTIDKNTKTLAALSSFQTKLQAVQDIAKTMANPIQGINSGTVTNVFNSRTASASTSNGQSYTDIVSISPGENAIAGSFSVKVNQLATSDMKKGVVQSTAINAALGITGSFAVSTAAGISKTIDITPTMSLSDIQSAINSVSDSTRVMADIALTVVGNPSTYELKIKAQQTGESIILNNTSATPLASLGFSQAPSNKLCGVLGATDEVTPLNLSGDFTFGVQSGPSATITLNNSMTLTDVLTAINMQTGTTGITASYDMVYYGSPSKYQLKLEAASGIIEVSDTAGAIAALGLNESIADFNSLCSKLTVDGTDYKKRSNIVSDIMTGVTLTLNSPSTATVYGVITEDKNQFADKFIEFMTAYNDLASFFNEQTKAKTSADGKSMKAAEGADLYGNTYVRDAMAKLKAAISGNTIGATLTTIQGSPPTALGLFGVKIQGDGTLKFENDQDFSDAISHHYSDIRKLLSNTMTVSNDSFTLASLPTRLPGLIAGKTITVNITKDASDDPTKTTANFIVDGVSYPAIVEDNGGIITVTGSNKKAGGSDLLQGISLRYSGALAAGASVSTTMSAVQGRMAVLDNELTRMLDETLSPDTDKKMGSLFGEIYILTKNNEEKQKRVDKIVEDAKKEASRIENQFQNVYKITMELENIMSMIDTFNKLN